jgi:malate synthase
MHNGVDLADGTRITRDLLEQLIQAEMDTLGADYAPARKIFEQVALSDDFTEFLTLPAGELID